MSEITMKPVAVIRTDFPEKFGIPRQSGLVESLAGRIIPEPEYRVREAFRGLEEFSHLWLVWVFSENLEKPWSPTVRPPRLGGNSRMGVFATRSPFRPNPIGLSCVRLEKIDWEDPEGPVLLVRGADLMDGTPILDIKPYLPYADALPDAIGGFAAQAPERRLEVILPPELAGRVPDDKKEALLDVLSRDPRPAYQNDPERVYGLAFAGLNLRFRVEEGRLTVLSAEPRDT